MNRTMVFVAAAVLTFAWSAGAKERKGPDLSVSAVKRIGPDRPSVQGWPGPPPDVEVAVHAGRAKTDSVRITIQSYPPYGLFRPTGVPRLGDRLYPMGSCMVNVEEGLLRRRREAFPETNIFNPGYWMKGRMNALSMYFTVSDGGGFGFRLLYDRRIRPTLGFNVSGEFTTYGGYRLNSLRTVLPDYTTRVSVIGIYSGLQQRFRDKGRVVPRIGFGAGPIIRVDHQAPPFYSGYYGPYAGAGGTYGGNYYNTGIGFPLGDFPKLSVTAGGYADAGIDVVVDRDRLYAVSLDARYNLIHFFDALGTPGDFGGPALYVGFGRRF